MEMFCDGTVCILSTELQKCNFYLYHEQKAEARRAAFAVMQSVPLWHSDPCFISCFLQEEIPMNSFFLLVFFFPHEDF